MRKLPIATLALAVTLLSGCVPTSRTMTPSPIPSATPVFASEDDALAAAEAAYAAYQSAVDAALSTYDSGMLEQVAIGDALQTARTSVSDFTERGIHQTGLSKIDSVQVAQLGSLLGESQPNQSMQVYACLDLSRTEVVRTDGTSAVSPARARRFPVVVELEWSAGYRRLLVSSENAWDGDDFCAK